MILASARAERRAHHDLALAGRAARHGDVGEVRAADEEQHANGRHQHVQGLAQAGIDGQVREAIDRDAPVLLDIRIVVRDLRRDGLHPRARLLERHPWLQPGQHLEPVIVAGALAGSEHQRTPEIGAPAIERAAAGHHPDHGERLAIEHDVATDDARSPANTVCHARFDSTTTRSRRRARRRARACGRERGGRRRRRNSRPIRVRRGDARCRPCPPASSSPSRSWRHRLEDVVLDRQSR